MAKIRHTLVKDDTIILPNNWGTATFDEEGFITNRKKLKCSDEDLLGLVNFEDGTAFAKDRPEPEETEDDDDDTDEKPELTDEEIRAGQKAVIEDMLTSGQADVLNTEGYVEMAALNHTLKEKGLPQLSGKERKELQDEVTGPGE